ncbi:MAG: LPS biosynthesis protein WbpP [Polynucleobacter sp. 39-45-136]|jgi:UDP-N-acetylglucosamine 4-epimerase|nr:MAG: LPS biosynthesis protein WbpP [Polynucleobacter sp. 39-45-136]
MSAYETLLEKLKVEEHTWLVTGVAGFIGSNLLETLLKHNQKVVGLDNFSTGFQHNLDEVKSLVSSEQWERFQFIEGDIRNIEDCLKACKGVEYVLHEAALGSVPRSIADPITTNEVNISGFLNMLVAVRDCKVKRMVYAASSSTYGDHPDLPKIEDRIGKPLSPYAVTKYVNELYADVFAKTYDMQLIGLRYFNVFGPRQNPQGAYAAVIPTWIKSMLANKAIYINGDGETSRDFCFIANAVQANILAAMSNNPEVINQVFNVAVGEQNSLKRLFELLKESFNTESHAYDLEPIFKDFRPGDVRYSLADISKANKIFQYLPGVNLSQGVNMLVRWWVGRENISKLNKIDKKVVQG